MQGDDDLVVIHDALGFGGCHLAVAVGSTSFELYCCAADNIIIFKDTVSFPCITPHKVQAEPLKSENQRLKTGLTNLP